LFGITLVFSICTPELVVLFPFEAKHRHQVFAEVHPIIRAGVLGKENFDASVTISVPDLNDGFVLRIIVH